MFKVLSPAQHLRSAMTALAFTDYRTHADFLRQCRQYRQAILDDFRGKGLFTPRACDASARSDNAGA